MTPEQFVNSLGHAVVDENATIYRRLFEQASAGTARDAYWINAAAFYSGLTAEQKDVFFQVIRQVIVDTTSNVLGVLDGSSHIDGAPRIELNIDGHRIRSDLQDMFLADQERGA